MIMCEIIGRKKEIAELKRYYESGRAEFVAVYGRRRVAKTFLIDEVFHDDMVSMKEVTDDLNQVFLTLAEPLNQIMNVDEVRGKLK